MATAAVLLAASLSPWTALGKLLFAISASLLLLSLATQTPIEGFPLTRRIRSRLAGTSLLVGTFLALALAPLGAGGAGISLGLLLAIATRRAPIGGENEASYPEVHRALGSGGTALALLLAVPSYVPEAQAETLVLIAATTLLLLLLGAAAALLSAGARPEIRAFLLFLLPGLVLGAGAAALPLAPFPRAGVLLLSRLPLALAALFILRQYTRWGFVAVRSSVIFLVLLSTAGVVSFGSVLLAPRPVAPRGEEWALLLATIGALETVLLLSLPAVIAHYDRGTMRVTWTLLTLALYWEAVLPAAVLLAPGEELPRDARMLVLLAHGLAALALLVAGRYLSLLGRSSHAAAPA